MGLLPAYAVGAIVSLAFVTQWLLCWWASQRDWRRADGMIGAAPAVTAALVAVVTLVLGRTFFARQLVLSSLVCLWAARHALFMWQRAHAKEATPDSRLDGPRRQPVLLFLLFSAQALAVSLLLLPLIAVNGIRRDAHTASADYVGAALWALGFFVETVADLQKVQFRARVAGTSKMKWMETGLWRFSRHPNMFGHILQWCGVFVISQAVLPWTWFPVAMSPVTAAVLVISASGIPPLERLADSRWGDVAAYKAYKSRTSILIPWPLG